MLKKPEAHASQTISGSCLCKRHNLLLKADLSILVNAALQVLLEITKICLTEASALLTDTQQLAQQIKQMLEARKAKVEEDGNLEEIGGDNSADIEDVRQYFEEHHTRQAREQSDSEATVNPGASSLGSPQL